MTEEELRDAIDGLSAYDNGCVDSGIHDEALRARFHAHIGALAKDERRKVLSRVMRDLFLTDEAIARGYGWEDAGALAAWYDEQFGVE